MASDRGDPIFCENLGKSTDNLQCCYPDDQNARTCRTNFNNPDVPTFSGACETRNCLHDCQDVSIIYSSKTQGDAYEGNGLAPIRRYLTCANVPNMAGYLSHDVLGSSIRSQVEKYIPRDDNAAALKNITSAVTECLTATCGNARHPNTCHTQCSGVNLLTNSSTPNVQGINQCLSTLCTGGYDSLPFADADVVGIGVFASYIMQCMFVVILWFGLTSFELFKHHRAKHASEEANASDQPKEKSKLLGLKLPASKSNASERKPVHQRNFESFLVQFHQAQCYFSATIQIASLSYGIFDTDMLNTFLLLPLATNGILPVVFSYVLLLRCRKASMDATLLTTLCWLLASLVYWILYSHVIPINSEIRDEKRIFRAYQQFMYKLSALDACGGYSALAVCPENFKLGKDKIMLASYRLRVLTPIIWTFSTVCILIALAEKVHRWFNRPSARTTNNNGSAELEQNQTTPPQPAHSPRSPFTNTIIYGLITMCFLAGVGMQLSLLSVSTSLKMTDRLEWGFGQIVAVTIWVPPLLGYLYDTIKVFIPAKFKTGEPPEQNPTV
ncbi:Nn.00g043960.m01.CDS01 [Neocucurbitaria sp. VM-36]